MVPPQLGLCGLLASGPHVHGVSWFSHPHHCRYIRLPTDLQPVYSWFFVMPLLLGMFGKACKREGFCLHLGLVHTVSNSASLCGSHSFLILGEVEGVFLNKQVNLEISSPRAIFNNSGYTVIPFSHVSPKHTHLLFSLILGQR